MLAIVALAFSGFALATTNINSATLDQLQALPGIGPVKAQAIIDYRKANGKFKKIDEITKVKGIDTATFEKLKGELAVSGKTTPPAEAPAAAAPAAAPAAKAAPAPAAAAPAKTK
jgi:competence protein ComEA